MKKVLGLIIITISTILLTGCGKSNKNLNCTIDIPSTAAAGVTGELVVDATFKSDKIQDINMQMNYKLSESKKGSIDLYMNSAESSAKRQYSSDHIKVSVNKTSDLEFSIKIDMDFKNMTQEEKNKVGFGKGNESYALNKAELEKQGYKCK